MPNYFECPLEAYFRRNDSGYWEPCYIRGTGETEELAQLHAERLRAKARHEIAAAIHRGETTPYRLSRQVVNA